MCRNPGRYVVRVAFAVVREIVGEPRDAGDKARDSVFIRTAHGFGYAFCGDVRESSAPLHRGVTNRRPLAWIEWGRKRFPLTAGEHIIGRDPDAGMSLDAATVSRHHARLIVSSEATMFGDLGSKNGTFRGDQRVTAPVKLADGDSLRIGSLLVTFRTRAQSVSTVTATSVPQ